MAGGLGKERLVRRIYTEMIIFCKICGHRILSPKPANEAQRDVLQQMSNHIGTHQDHAITLAKTVVAASQLLATYLLIKRYVRIPPEEKELLETFRENEESLIQIFGLELETEEAKN
jgi:hypothetical protein